MLFHGVSCQTYIGVRTTPAPDTKGAKERPYYLEVFDIRLEHVVLSVFCFQSLSVDSPDESQKC